MPDIYKKNTFFFASSSEMKKKWDFLSIFVRSKFIKYNICTLYRPYH